MYASAPSYFATLPASVPSLVVPALSPGPALTLALIIPGASTPSPCSIPESPRNNTRYSLREHPARTSVDALRLFRPIDSDSDTTTTPSPPRRRKRVQRTESVSSRSVSSTPGPGSMGGIEEHEMTEMDSFQVCSPGPCVRCPLASTAVCLPMFCSLSLLPFGVLVVLWWLRFPGHACAQASDDQNSAVRAVGDVPLLPSDTIGKCRTACFHLAL